jgi:D-alanyl-D-alanine carboxypeptidase (penicillin-binding protein 5/6)
VRLLEAGMPLAEPRVWKGRAEQVVLGVTADSVMTLPRSSAAIERVIEVDAPLQAPLNVGDRVGRIMLSRSGEPVGEVPLEVLQAVEPAGFFARLWDGIVLWFQQLFG